MIQILKYAHHRNGCSGRSFGVALFKSQIDGTERTMLGVLFGVSEPTNDELDEPRCAVFDFDLLKDSVIEFGENSWRGDHYHHQLRAELVKRWPWGEMDAPEWARHDRESEAANVLLGVEV